LYFGVGRNILIPGEKEEQVPVISFKYEMNQWFIATNYIESYEVYGVKVDSHVVFAGGYKVFKYDFSRNKYFYTDLGLATTKKSIANSSDILFYVGFGFYFEGFTAEVIHTSNGGFDPPNEGETSFTIGYSISFD